MLMGFDNGLIGPCVPDLRQSVGVSLQYMSYIFLLQGFGALLGNFLALFPERRFDRRLLTAVYVLLGSVVNVLVPLKANYYYMLVFFLLQGIAKGMSDFAAISLCNTLWKEDKALPFQFMINGAGISTFISPLIAQPFIKATGTHISLTGSDPDTSCPSHGVFPNNSTMLALMAREDQSDHGGNFSRPYNRSDVIFYGADGDVIVVNEDIKWPFIIAGLVTLPASIAFFYFYFTRPKLCESDETPPPPPPQQEVKNPVEKTDTLTSRLIERPKGKPPSWAVYVFKGLLIFLHLPVFGLLLALGDLLSSIGMMPPLCMTASDASYFPTAFWAASMMSRALGVLFLFCFSVFVHLLFNSSALVISGAVLLTGTRSHVVAMWVGTAGVGLFGTNFMPGYIAWSGEFLPITPLFMNLSLCMAGVGELLLPFVSGQLLAAFGPWVMLWVLLIVMLLMLIIFLCAAFVGKRYIQGAAVL
ncbi:hypothetical protein ACOMHN_019442 [Nucella lapillus]